jgi:hypothetical protein
MGPTLPFLEADDDGVILGASDHRRTRRRYSSKSAQTAAWSEAAFAQCVTVL